LTISFF